MYLNYLFSPSPYNSRFFYDGDYFVSAIEMSDNEAVVKPWRMDIVDNPPLYVGSKLTAMITVNPESTIVEYQFAEFNVDFINIEDDGLMIEMGYRFDGSRFTAKCVVTYSCTNDHMTLASFEVLSVNDVDSRNEKVSGSTNGALDAGEGA